MSFLIFLLIFFIILAFLSHPEWYLKYLGLESNILLKKTWGLEFLFLYQSFCKGFDLKWFKWSYSYFYYFILLSFYLIFVIPWGFLIISLYAIFEDDIVEQIYQFKFMEFIFQILTLVFIILFSNIFQDFSWLLFFRKKDINFQSIKKLILF